MGKTLGVCMDKKKDIFSTGNKKNENKKPDNSAKLVGDCLQELFVVTGMGFSELCRVVYRNFYYAFFIILIIALKILSIIKKGQHMEFIHRSDPNFFTIDRLNYLYKLTFSEHVIALSIVLLLCISVILGIKVRFVRTKYKKLFERIGLSANDGSTPKLLYKENLSKKRSKLVFDAQGFDVKAFEEKLGRLESSFNTAIESIKEGQNKRNIEIILTKEKIVNRITLKEISAMANLPSYSFYIGKSVNGVIVGSIADFPHFLTAGTTGAGKSNGLKGMGICLLNSSPHLQLYAIDLKGGLEMVDFAEAPNVRVVKNLEEAVCLLKQIEDEMKRRFDFMEAKGLKDIVPARDKMDRIVLVVDESSVLYMNRRRNDPDYETALVARTITDSIAKQSRAAGINLVLATQKLTAEVIPTSVTENISARLCFKANSLQGSLLVVGNKDAMELPEIKGRAVWSYGSNNTVVQTPYVEPSDIKECIHRVQEAFRSNTQKCFAPMLGLKAKAKAKKNEEMLDNDNLGKDDNE